MTPETERIIARLSKQFMQPDVEHAEYWEISANHGETHIIPADVVTIDSSDANSWEDLGDYIEGAPDRDPDGRIIAERKFGWVARLSAPGYMDCTEWTAHETEDEAYEYLAETYGDDLPEGDMECRACQFIGDSVQDFISSSTEGERNCPQCGSAECYMREE